MIISLQGYSTIYYSNTAGGDATNTANWFTNNNNTGTNPPNFTTPGDIFIVQSNMTTSTTWNVAGTIEVNSGSLTATNTVSLMNMTIGGGTLTLNGGGINITTGGAWAYNSGTFNPGNNAANIVSFGSSTTIGGTLPTTFTYLTINTTNPTDTVTLLTSGITVAVNSGNGGILSLTKGVFNIGSGNTLNFATPGGGAGGIVNPNATGTSNFATNGTNGSNGGTIDVLSGGGNTFTVSGTGATTFYNLSFASNATFNNNNAGTFINGTLSIPNNNWSMSGNSPIYGTASTLSYNEGGSNYTTGLEWTPSTNPTVGVTPGYPNNVIVNSTGGAVSTSAGSHGLAGNLTLNGSLNLATNNPSSFIVNGNVIINSGTFTASSSGGIYLKGNWTRAAGGNFAANGGTVNFVGHGTAGSPQIITGPSGGENDFGNVTIGSASTGSTYVSLASPVTLTTAGNLTLTSGIVQTTSTNLLTVSNTAATAITGGSSSNFVNGPLAWSLPATTTGSYIFPVGNGSTYLPFTLAPNTSSPTTATITAYTGNSGGHPDGTTVTSLSSSEYWSLSTTTNLTTGGSVSVGTPTSVAPYNIIAESSSANGTYSSVGGSPSGTSINNSTNIGANSPLFFTLGFGPLIVQTVSITNPSCDGTMLGSVTVQGSSGTAPYKYKIGSGAYGAATTGSATFSGLAAGTYIITIEDASTPTPATATDTVIISPPLTVSGDTTINTCAGSSAQLEASGGALSYSWTPATGLSSSTIANPVATPSVTTTYYVTSTINNPNLVQNPNFAEENTGFTSGYTYYDPGAPYAVAPQPHTGLYNILGNANQLCSGFDNFGPVTGTTMYVCDGPDSGTEAEISTIPAWSETLTGLTTNTNYTFSYYIRSGDGNAPPQLQTTINGASMGVSTATEGAWTQVTYTWNSGTNTSATISLFDTGPNNTVDNGNDFALDDMNFNSTCQTTDSVTVTVIPCATFGSFASAPYMDICSNNKDSSGFYNTTGSGASLIGVSTFTGTNFGTYIENSHSLELNGGEVKTFKNTGANVCGSTLYYTIYPQGDRPTSPVFIAMPLPYFDGCVGSAFPTGGPCMAGDQKWQAINQNIDLTTFAPGTYTLEIYYQVVGDSNSTSGCADTLYTNNSGSNYLASFIIIPPPTILYPTPLCISETSPQSVTLTGTTGGSYTVAPPGLTINNATGAITPSSSTPGTYIITYLFNDANGCSDSIISTVTIIDTSASTTAVTVCQSLLPYAWNGHSYGSDTTAALLFTNAAGCDSVATLKLTVTDTSASTTAVTVCQSLLPYAWNGHSYGSDTTAALLFTNAAGCDSVATLKLAVTDTSASTTAVTVCQSLLPYTWNGHSYGSDTTAALLFTNAAGCDSVATLKLAVTDTSASTTAVTVCQSLLPYAWNGHSYGSDTTAALLFTNAAGCDSVATLKLTVTDTSASTTAVTVCQSLLPYTWNGHSYGSDTTAALLFTNAAGCDSVATLKLTVTDTSASTTAVTVCQSLLPYTWNGHSYGSDTTATLLFTNAAGCDSVATLKLTVTDTSASTTAVTVCQSLLPYTWNGHSYGSDTTATLLFTNAAGCDSIATLKLTVTDTSASTTAVTVCQSLLPYTWNGHSYGSDTTAALLFTNAAGCDSVATLKLTVTDTSASTTAVTVCQSLLPYAWNGHSYGSDTTAALLFTNAAGCDSVATLKLTVTDTSASTTAVTVCQSLLPYTWNGHSYGSDTTAALLFTNAAGCDSVATLKLTVTDTSASTTAVTVCQSLLPYAWNGHSYGSDTTAALLFTNAAGCDSIATLKLTVTDTSASTTAVTVCQSLLPYTWNGHTYSSDTTAALQFTNAAGCDSVATLKLAVTDTSASTTTVTVCQNQLPYTWNGHTYSSDTTAALQFTNAAGCDSVATLKLAVTDTSASTTTVTVCQNQLPYTWNGNTYSSDTTAALQFTNAAGCDSVATLKLAVTDTSASTTTVTVCQNQLPYTWNGHTYSSDTTAALQFTNAAGCDSVATLKLAVTDTSASTTTVTVCQNQLPYTWNGNTYSSDTTAALQFTNAAGCDSVATLKLAVTDTSASTTAVTVCQNQLPYTWNGHTYSSDTTAALQFTNASGCDSVATLKLAVTDTSASTTTVTVCQNQLPYTWNGNTYSSDTTAALQFTNAAGCDSVATLKLTVTDTSASTTAVTVCQSLLPYTWNGHSYGSDTTAALLFTNAAGCDSVATLKLTVTDTSASTTAVTVCQSLLPYAWNGHSYGSDTTAALLFTNAAGCDSIATLKLTVTDTSASTTAVTVCQSLLPYAWNGHSYGSDTTAALLFTNAAGCDSVATLKLTVTDTSASTTAVTVCQSLLPYAWNGHSYGSDTTAALLFTNAAGCDSIATLKLTVTDTSASTTAVTVCQSLLPYTWNGHTYSSDTTAALQFTNAAGCDSVATLKLAVTDTSASTTTVTVCQNQLPYTWNGHTYSSDTTAALQFTNAAGCDSVATLKLAVTDTSASTTTVTVCQNQLPYTWNGHTYSSDTTAALQFTNAAGCDSVATLKLAVTDTSASTTMVTVCQSLLPYAWNGHSYGSDTTAALLFTNAAGCDSVATLKLTVTDTSASTTAVTVCQSLLPYAWNGHSYGSDTTAALLFTNAAGCDSVATLKLTVTDTSASTTAVTVCQSLLPYTWNGHSYGSDTTAALLFTNAAGCDSIATLKLTVTDTSASTTAVTVCQSLLPYAWNGHSYGSDTTAALLFTNAAGCDSVATLKLTVTDTSASTTAVTVCQSLLPYAWNGHSYGSDTTAALLFTNAAGCDSVATLKLTVTDTSASTTAVTVCQSLLPYTWNGHSYGSDTTAALLFTNAAGCDSVATLKLAVTDTSASTTTVTVCQNQLPYTWNGHTYSSDTTAALQFTNAAGCDSVATLKLAVTDTSASTTTVTVCQNQLPYTWNGNTYSSDTTAALQFTNAAGCDSVATLKLAVTDTSASTTAVTVCQNQLPYTWNGHTYSSDTTAALQFTNASGCDSVATLKLAVTDTSASTTTVTVCQNQLPYTWNGNTYSSDTTAALQFTNAAGCDSVATLKLTVTDTSASTTAVTVCQSLLPYTWNGHSYGSDTTAALLFTNAAGCDSVATLKLTVTDTSASTTAVTVCQSLLPYAWNGHSYGSDTTAALLFTNAAGCDSIATLKLTVTDTSASTTAVTVCQSLLPYAWNGHSYGSDTTAALLFTNAAGCDSVATLKLTVTDTSASTTAVTVCQSLLPYAWNGHSYGSDTTAALLFTNAAGCDSIATLKLTVTDTSASTTAVTVCQSLLPYTWNGHTYSSDTTAALQFTNAAGCDSVATLKLAVTDTSASTTTVTVCQNQLPYTWNGHTYSSDTTAALQFTNAAGCDSVATLKLAVTDTSASTTMVTVCQNQLPYTWNGHSYGSDTTAALLFTNAAGCDSVATLKLTVTDTSASTTAVTVCQSLLPYAWNGHSYGSDTTAALLFTNAAGCDSVATLKLTVTDTSASTTAVTVCQSLLPYTWNGHSYGSDTTATLLFTNAAGCDSVATLKLTVTDTSASTTTVTVCQNQLPYAWNGNNYSSDTIASLHFNSAQGCDSIATLVLTVTDTVKSITGISVCQNQLPYAWNGNNYSSDTIASLYFTGAQGCDSIATMVLTVTDTLKSITGISVCQNQLPYAWNGNNYSSDTIASLHFTSAQGCDSIATLVLTVTDTLKSITGISVCQNQLPYAWNGHSYGSDTTAALLFTNAAGCDSVATLKLTVTDTSASTTTVTVCQNQLPYAWNGNNYSSDTIASLHFNSAQGCDSIATLVLTVTDTLKSITGISVCQNQLPYAWNGNNYSSDTIASLHFTSAQGCDSIATLVLTVTDTVKSITGISVCQNQLPYAWNGNNYSSDTIASLHFTGAQGCDSIATLVLTVTDTVKSITGISVCQNQLPYAWNGNNYSSDTIASLHFTSAQGCDSIATLKLTVTDTSASTTAVTVCQNQLPYAWNGNNYSSDTIASLHFTSAQGCDSIATLVLTVTDTVKSAANISVCQNQLPYAWNGNNYSSDTIASLHFTSAQGCDSIATLKLTVTDTSASTTAVTVCQNQLPYAWNGNNYSSDTIASLHFTGAQGCDSIATLVLTVTDTVKSITGISVCQNQLPYAWNGNNYSSDTIASLHFTSAQGCDSIATLVLTVTDTVKSITGISVCQNQLPYAWNGNNYSSDTIASLHFTSAQGCDSIATLVLTVTDTVKSITGISVCQNQLPYAWNGNNYSSDTIASLYFTGAQGCDSIATLVLTVTDTLKSITGISVCQNQLPYAWNGNNYSSDTIASLYFTGAQGCDSIATLVLTVTDTVKSITGISVCQNQLPYAWNGNNYSSDTIASLHFTSAQGCDSIATLVLTVTDTLKSITGISVCQNQLPYAWNGNNYSSDTIASLHFTSAQGCDSIATLVLTVTDTVKSAANISVCQNQLPYAWNGNNYSSDTIASLHFTSAQGCDSIATLKLTVTDTSASTTAVTVCQNQLPYAWNGNNYSSDTIASLHFTGAQGCDSIATLVLTVTDTVKSITGISVCQNQLPYAWNGNNYSSDTIASLHFTGAQGCDSIATLVLTVTDTVKSITGISVCQNQLPYAWNGNNYSSDTIASLHFTSAQGCDSIATLVLTVTDTLKSITGISVCQNQLPYAWNGNNYSSDTIASLHFTGAQGCDSIATLVLTVTDTLKSITGISVCQNQLPYAWNGNNYSSDTIASLHFTGAQGCDSIATLVLTVTDTLKSITGISVCQNQLPYAWNGNNYSSDTIASLHFTGAQGCDSIATLVLTVTDTVKSITGISVCQNQLPYAWNGNNYSSDTIASLHFTSAQGCDSIATLVLTVTDTLKSITGISVCQNQLPYAWNGNNYSSDTIASLHFTSAQGCDSIATLVLTVTDTVKSITGISVCQNQLPYAWNGNNYSSDTIASLHFTSAQGCDSIATLNLTVTDTVKSNTTVTVCQNQLPYAWNGVNYTDDSIVSLHFTSAEGCDSIATLNLTVTDTVKSNTTVTVCQNQLPYAWNGVNYTDDTIVSLHFTSAEGCDSIATLNLTVTDTVKSVTNITVCQNLLPYAWNGVNYTDDTIVSLHFTSAQGCDSIATLNLTITDTVKSVTNITVCQNLLPYAWNGVNYTDDTIVSLHFTSAQGCDSVATLVLSILSTVNTQNINLNNCSKVVFGGVNYTSSTIIHDTLKSIGGCDSIYNIIYITITPISPITKNTFVSSCGSVLLGGITYTSSTIIRDTINSVGACDSVYNITAITITPISPITKNTFVNSCSSVLLGGITYSSSTIIRDTLKSIGGCDSIYNIATITIAPIIPVTQNTSLSGCTSVIFAGTTYTSSTILIDTIKSLGGCDSIYNKTTINITPIVPVTIEDSLIGCSSLVSNGITYTSSAVVKNTIQSVGGCDSVYHITNIIISPNSFDLSLNATANDVNSGTTVNIISSANIPSYTIISWEPSDEFPSQNVISQAFVADTTTRVLVTAESNTGCVDTAGITIVVKQPNDFYVPNAFTPNADGRDDYFSVYGSTIDHGLLRIYNQWGQLLFETTDIKKGWDGTYKGVPQPVGVYAYVVFAVMYDGTKATAHGFLNLIR